MTKEERAGKAGRQLAATGETVRANVKRIRADVLRMPVTELSRTLEVLGRPIPPLGLRRIEDGTRRVDVDDLVSIAAALGVSPAALLMPARNDDGSEVRAGDLVPITGWRKPITASAVWRWLIAAAPLVRGTMSSLVENGLPAWERERIEADMRAAQQRSRDDLYGGNDGNC